MKSDILASPIYKPNYYQLILYHLLVIKSVIGHMTNY